MSEHNNQPLENMRVVAERLRAVTEAVRTSFEQLTRSVTEPIEESLRQIQEVVQTALQDLPAKSREALTTLGEHGWYLDLEFSLPGLTSLAEAFSKGDVEGAERNLVDHYRGKLSQIEDELATLYPARAKILMSTFEAHRSGKYELSVPVFLVQADGICKKCLGVSLFRRSNRRPVTAEAIENRRLDQDSIEAAMLHPLKIQLFISASEGELVGLLNVLNRHEILHGISVDYGTEMNSLKAISLLYYVASVLPKPAPA